MGMSKAELHAELRQTLEQLLRDQRQVEEEKKASADGYNTKLKAIAQSIADTLEELDTCQARLFNGDGEAAV